MNHTMRHCKRYRLPTAAAAGLACVVTSACSSQAPPAAERTGTTDSALVAGAVSLSGFRVPNSMAESQTAAIAMNGFLVTAFNVFNAPEANFRTPPVSQLGIAYVTPNVTARALHFDVPAEVTALRFGPSLAYYDAGDRYKVFVSAVAYSPNIFNQRMTYEDYAHLQGDMVCVFTVDFLKTEDDATVVDHKCMGGFSPYYWDTALTVFNTVPYVTSWDMNSRSVHVFNAFTRSPVNSPFPSSNIDGSAIFAKVGAQTSLTLVAPSNVSGFLMSSFNPNTGIWSPPITMSPVPSGFGFSHTLPFGMEGSRDYTAVIVPNGPAPQTTYLFYRQGTQIVGFSRGGFGPSPPLTQVFTSRAGFDAFQPAAEVATIPQENGIFSGAHPLLTYWDNSGPGGILSLNRTWPGQPVISLATETPCPHDTYWGLYDDMAVRNNNTSLPSIWRPFTDSTDGTCAETEDWSSTTVQHVSAVVTHATNCSHDPCVQGASLVGSCNACVQSVCNGDSYCCTTAWDDICVGEIPFFCGVTC